MHFHYRYVGYGTTFTPVEACAPAATNLPPPAPHLLHRDELALDVGGRCLGYQNEATFICDHHFVRPGQFPSASAAVLHLAPILHARFCSLSQVTFVTHRQPDFDAFCSAYLARHILTGLIPLTLLKELNLQTDGWYNTPSELDWFAPDLSSITEEHHWPFLLAAYASHVDQARHMATPRHRSLHAILYAALARGRNLPPTGAYAFFEEIRAAITHHRLNPLFDSVLEHSTEFAPELSLLDRETLAYNRDIARARRSIVFLQVAPSETWYPQATQVPLLQPDGSLNPFHLTVGRHSLRQADAIFLRDPECLLFKEWARSDMQNSFSHQGFLFTAVAYSNTRLAALRNSTDYFFALDPERAAGAHLYNLWAQLQTQEVAALRQAPNHIDPPPLPRPGFHDRAVGFPAQFADPWFDGGNFRCTLLVTPNVGTHIAPPGHLANLEDDAIACLAQNALELAVFDSPLYLQDLPSGGNTLPPEKSFSPQTCPSHLPPPSPTHYRFARIQVAPDIDLQNPHIAEQIGHYLWTILNPEATHKPPTDFLSKYLIADGGIVGVWSRHGVALAHYPSETPAAHRTRELLQSLIRLASRAEKSLQLPPAERLAALEAHLRESLQLKHQLTLPKFRLLLCFYEASRIDEVLAASRELDQADSDRRRSDDMSRALHEIEATQKKVEWVEVFLIAVYAIELVKAVHESLASGHILIGVGILFLGLFGMAAAIAALNLAPELFHSLIEKKHRARLSGIALWFLLFLAFLILTLFYHSNQSPHNPTPTTTHAP